MAQIKSKKIIDLAEKSRLLPKKPGCYLFYNKSGDVLYVGKAKDLRSRVSSYFKSDHKDSIKTKYLVEKIETFEFELTDSEAEAFVLENVLIKKFRPKYNIRLKDDKSYPYVIVDMEKDFPRIEFRRRVKKDRTKKTYGPFVTGSNISATIKEVVKAYGLRDCSDYEFRSRKTPCLLYQLHQCTASCMNYIDKAQYHLDLNQALNVFKGKGKTVVDDLKKRMGSFANNEEFEKAALVRNSIKVIEEFNQNYTNIASKEGERSWDIDILNIHISEFEIDISISVLRNGVNFGHKSFYFFKEEFQDEEVNLEDSLCQFYFMYLNSSNDTIPKQVYLPIEKSFEVNSKIIQESVLEKLGSKIRVVRNSGRLKSLIELTGEQALENYNLRQKNKDSSVLALKKLQSILSLKEVPKVLECYDVAIFQGKSPTASQITFIDGSPFKNQYRHYHLKELDEGNNDFKMMQEVASRRAKKSSFPDVFIIDGGKGQVSSFLKGLGHENKAVVIGIAKSKVKGSFSDQQVERTEERLIIPGRKDPVILKKGSALYRLIAQMRDEAHRFSRRLHHKKEERKLTSSWLDLVSGIGPKAKEKILGNLNFEKDKLKNLTVEELSSQYGVSKKQAGNILEFLNGKN